MSSSAGADNFNNVLILILNCYASQRHTLSYLMWLGISIPEETIAVPLQSDTLQVAIDLECGRVTEQYSGSLLSFGNLLATNVHRPQERRRHDWKGGGPVTLEFVISNGTLGDPAIFTLLSHAVEIRSVLPRLTSDGSSRVKATHSAGATDSK